MGQASGQANAEYLLLLGAALIVAITVISLLSFYPNVGSKTAITESVVYWKSASPIAVTEVISVSPRWSAYWDSIAKPCIHVKNTGPAPIRITKLLAAGKYSTSQVFNATGGLVSISDMYYMAPNEEKHFCYPPLFQASPGSVGVDLHVFIVPVSKCPSAPGWLCGATSACKNNYTAGVGGYGFMEVPDFGFEYIVYSKNNQQVTKRQIGAVPLLVECQLSPA